MPNKWSAITIDCLDPVRLAEFWSELLHRPISAEHEEPGWATVGSRLDDHPRLTFQAVPEPKLTKIRIHLDIQVDDIERGREEVEALGGRGTGERHEYDQGVVTVMQDPEGHEFCLVQYYECATVVES